MTGLVLERRLPAGSEAPPTTNGVLAASSIGALRKSSRHRRDWRGWAKREAEQRGWTPFEGPVGVEVVHLRPSRSGWPDVGASYFLAKAMLDGLVDAHVLEDDDPDHVESMHFRIPEVVGVHGVRMTVRLLEHHEPFTPALFSPFTERTPAS
jgi:hypothetical protein